MMNLAREINNFTDSIIKIARTRRSYPISLPEINEVFRHVSKNKSMIQSCSKCTVFNILYICFV